MHRQLSAKKNPKSSTHRPISSQKAIKPVKRTIVAKRSIRPATSPSTLTSIFQAPSPSIIAPRSTLSHSQHFSSQFAPLPSALQFPPLLPQRRRQFSTTPPQSSPQEPIQPIQPTPPPSVASTESQSSDPTRAQPEQVSEQPRTEQTVETAENTPQAPSYAKFKRARSKFVPTESYFDENGDECLVVYEVDQEVQQLQLRERKRALINTLLVGPLIAACSWYGIPTPYSYLVIGIAGIFTAANALRVYGLTGFVTKITAVWPQERSPITNKLHGNLNEALMGLSPLPEENNGDEEETEFSQRNNHNAHIKAERGEKDIQDTEPVADTTEEVKKARTHSYPQPGVTPTGDKFAFDNTRPDMLTWKFGWTDLTRTANAADKDSWQFPLFRRADWNEDVRAWAELPDPDFPEYVYIDRLNDGKSPLYQKSPLSDFFAVWSVPAVPPAIPQVTTDYLEELQTRPYQQSVCLFRIQNTASSIFPKFIKHDVAMNQIIFASNINARNSVQDKFEAARGRRFM